MTTQDIKLSIHQIIEKEEDAVLLKTIRDVIQSLVNLRKSQVAGYEADGTPITAEELEQIVVASSERAKTGHLVSHEDLLKQMEDW